MAAENPLTKLPLLGQLGVSAAVAVVILGLFWWQYWDPKTVQQEAKIAQLKGLEDDIRRLEAVAAKLGEFQSKVTQLEAELERLKQLLPPQKETPDLMRKVEYLARESNLIVRRFQPGPTVNKDFYQEWPINIDVEGNYHNLALFFDRVGRLPRLVNAGNIRVRSQAKQSSNNTIASSCVATTYVYVEKPPTPPGPVKK
jgi:type IV pilus assembly protein PilO